MASRWGTAWANAWASSWDRAEVVEPTIIIVGGDDAPRKRKRKEKTSHDFFRELEATVHELLHPPQRDEGYDKRAPYAEPPRDVDRKLDELLLLAKGQHDLLQRVARLRADVQGYEADRDARLAQALSDDDEEMMMLS